MLKEEYSKWLKLRSESAEKDGTKLCYCSQIKKCDCSDPSFDYFKYALEKGDIVLGDPNNGWVQRGE